MCTVAPRVHKLSDVALLHHRVADQLWVGAQSAAFTEAHLDKLCLQVLLAEDAHVLVHNLHRHSSHGTAAACTGVRLQQRITQQQT